MASRTGNNFRYGAAVGIVAAIICLIITIVVGQEARSESSFVAVARKHNAIFSLSNSSQDKVKALEENSIVLAILGLSTTTSSVTFVALRNAPV